MGYVCCSVKDALQQRYENLQKSNIVFKTDWANQIIITEKAYGVRPKLSGYIITESAPMEINTIAYGYGRYGHSYSIKENLQLNLLNSATKDDLCLFIITAHPEVFANPKLKNILFNRLSEIHQKEFSIASLDAQQLEEDHKIEIEQFEFIFDTMSNAVYNNCSISPQDASHIISYTKGHTEEDSICL